MIKPPLTQEEIKGLQEISNDLAGLQILISQYKTKVDSIVNKYSNPRGAVSRTTLLRKAKKLEMKSRVGYHTLRWAEKRFGYHPDLDKRRAELRLLEAEAQRLRIEADKLF